MPNITNEFGHYAEASSGTDARQSPGLIERMEDSHSMFLRAVGRAAAIPFIIGEYIAEAAVELATSHGKNEH